MLNPNPTDLIEQALVKTRSAELAQAELTALGVRVEIPALRARLEELNRPKPKPRGLKLDHK